MQVGSFGPVVFEVTDKKVFTPDSRSRTNTSNWATHDRIEGKSRSQYLSPGLTQVQYKVRIRADMGMRPQATIDLLHTLAQSRQVYPLFMGGVPQAPNPFKLKECQEDDSLRLPTGELFSCEATLSFEEYT